MPATLRAFIALELPPALTVHLADVISHLDKALPPRVVRWVRPDGIHLTLKFLGDVPENHVPRVQTMIGEAANEVSPFEFVLGGLACFPNLKQPRVIWAGLREIPEALRRLQHAVEQGAARLGYPPEGRDFAPHLTLGRVYRDARGADLRRIGEIVQAEPAIQAAAARIEEVCLIKSDLKPGGAVYTRLYAARLGGGDSER